MNTIEKLLFDSEVSPLFGTVPDRYRTAADGSNIYMFGDAWVTCTMEASSDKVAIAAINFLMTALQRFIIHYPASSLEIPNGATVTEFEALYGDFEQDFGVFIAHNLDPILSALRSVRIGNLQARQSLKETLIAVRKDRYFYEPAYIRSWNKHHAEREDVPDWYHMAMNKAAALEASLRPLAQKKPRNATHEDAVFLERLYQVREADSKRRRALNKKSTSFIVNLWRRTKLK